ncbi:MAG: cohesin domain-containing protein [Candidatus Paceibacterota bacterium]|jgi:hypothetical protein|nr:cohesin domain-containing protein [Candidatus Paceibacterota bacterium]
MEKKFLKLIFFLAAFLCVPVSSFSATLEVSPSSGTYPVGQKFTVSVIAASDDPWNAVSLELLFPPSMFSVDSLSKDGSLLSFWINEPVISQSTGVLSVEGITPGGIKVPTGTVITATLHGTHAGTSTVFFQSGKILANDGHGTDITEKMTGAKFTITGSAAELDPVRAKDPIPVGVKEPNASLSPADIDADKIISVDRIISRIGFETKFAFFLLLLTIVYLIGEKIFHSRNDRERGSEEANRKIKEIKDIQENEKIR